LKPTPPSVYGLQPVKELLLAGSPVERLAVARGHHGPALREVIDLARQGDIPVRQEDRRQLDRWAEGGAHQGVVAWAAALPYQGEEELIASLGPSALVLVLDGVQDPRNLGALLRTAAAAGVNGVFLPERGAVGLTATVVKASAGLAGRVPVARAKNLARLLGRLKENGLWVVGLEASGAPAWGAFDFCQPLAVVLGGEGGGVRPLLRRSCDVLVGLPMAQGVDSLNVSVAGGIILYEALRQRSQAK
jgi:23S rRNA (guanosine2251-2'-O)-methyltransferase